MARDSGNNADLLNAALIGYQVQRDRISVLIADIQNQLGHRGPGRRKATPEGGAAVAVAAKAQAEPKRKRRLSAAGKARIVAATKARWEAYRQAKAAGKKVG